MNDIQEKQYNILVELDRVCKKLNINYQLSGGTLLGAIRHEGFIPWDDDIDVNMKRCDYNRFLEFAQQELNHNMFLQTNETDKEYYHGFAKIRDNSFIMKERSSCHLNINHGVWIDIFPYDKIPNDVKLAKQQEKKTRFYNKLMAVFVHAFVAPEDKGLKRSLKVFFKFFNSHIIKYTKIPRWIYVKRECWANKYNDLDSYKEFNLLVFNYNHMNYDSYMITKQEFTETIHHKFESKLFPITKDYDIMLTRLYGDYMTLPPKEEQISNHFYVD